MSEQVPNPGFDGVIDMTIAPDPRLVRPVRLALGGLASLAGFDVEAIGDLRIAVNELVATLIERGDGSAITLAMSAAADGLLRIEGRTGRGPVVDDSERFVLTDRILSVLADDHGFDTADSACTGWVERRRDDWGDGDEDGDGDGDGDTSDDGADGPQ